MSRQLAHLVRLTGIKKEKNKNHRITQKIHQYVCIPNQ